LPHVVHFTSNLYFPSHVLHRGAKKTLFKKLFLKYHQLKRHFPRWHYGQSQHEVFRCKAWEYSSYGPIFEAQIHHLDVFSCYEEIWDEIYNDAVLRGLFFVILEFDFGHRAIKKSAKVTWNFLGIIMFTTLTNPDV